MKELKEKMKRRVLRKWIPLSGILGIGVLVGLIVAGVQEAAPAGMASDLALEALREPGVTPASNVTVYEPAVPADTGSAQQERLPSLRDAAAAVRPAVVSVEVRGWREVTSSTLELRWPDGWPEEWRDLCPRYNTPQPDDERPGGRRRFSSEGSGFIFSKDGFIITNNHVVAGATEVTVTLPDKRRFEAEIVGTDEITDVAVIKIETDGELPTIPLGDSDTLEIGDWVLAVGNPLAFDYTVTAGIVSAKGRALDLGPVDVERNARLAIQDYIQTDAAINRGNSGGPLVDLNGRVVGINTAIASSTGLYAGYGFAIPINLARTVARDLIEYGKVKRSWLGILFREVDATIAMARSLPDNPPIGALVTEVTPGGSADRAGMQANDIILEIDGVPIENSGQLQTMVSTKRPGSRVEMVVYRGGNSRRVGRRVNLTVTLQERPDDTSPASQEREEEESDKLGLAVTELTRAHARELGYSGRGVWVESVEQYGPAFDANPNLIRGEFILVEVDGEEVNSLRDYNSVLEELKSGSYVIVRIVDPLAPEGNRESSYTVKVR